MDKNRIKYSYLIFIILIFFSSWCSSAISDPGKITAPPPSNTSIHSEISPLPSGLSIGGGGSSKGSKAESNGTEASGKEKEHKDVGLSKRNDTSNLDLNDKDKKVASLADPPVGKEEKEKQKVKGNKDGEGVSAKAGIHETGSCAGSAYLCRNQTMIACIQAFRYDSKDVSVVVQNVGEDILKVHINILPSVKNALPDLQLQKHESKLINVTLDTRKSSKVILNAGNGECVFQLGRPVFGEDFLQQLSIYSKQVTPLYGAYGFFVVALLFGGTWACCRLRKRGVLEGVQYQELEMGLPESAVAVNEESTEGWDQDWDDDWDEDDVVKSSSASRGGSVSANGLTSRASRTDGWDNDWDV